MQVRTARHDLTPTSMTTITRKKKQYNKSWQGCGEIGTPIHCRWECKMEQYPQNGMMVPQKAKLELPYDPAIPLLGI